MKISIITACYNSAATIKDTFDSILSQTYQNYEYIVIDGASTDNTVSIIKEYEPKFDGKMRWISEKDKGIYDAMNKGIAIASGDIIGILNSDDFYIDKNVLEDINNAFDNETGAICGNLYFVDSKHTNKIVRVWQGTKQKSFKKGWHPAHPTFYAKKELYDKYGNFDINFDVSADFELMLRFIEKNNIKTKYIDRFIVKMRHGGESTGSIKNILVGNKNIIRAFKKNEIPLRFPHLYILRRLITKLRHALCGKIGI